MPNNEHPPTRLDPESVAQYNAEKVATQYAQGKFKATFKDSGCEPRVAVIGRAYEQDIHRFNAVVQCPEPTGHMLNLSGIGVEGGKVTETGSQGASWPAAGKAGAQR